MITIKRVEFDCAEFSGVFWKENARFAAGRVEGRICAFRPIGRTIRFDRWGFPASFAHVVDVVIKVSARKAREIRNGGAK